MKKISIIVIFLLLVIFSATAQAQFFFNGGGGGSASLSDYTDVTDLFGSGSCSGYLKSDGTCSTPTTTTGDNIAPPTATPLSCTAGAVTYTPGTGGRLAATMTSTGADCTITISEASSPTDRADWIITNISGDGSAMILANQANILVLKNGSPVTCAEGQSVWGIRQLGVFLETGRSCPGQYTIDDSTHQFVGVTSGHLGELWFDLSTSTSAKHTKHVFAQTDDRTVTWPDADVTFTAGTQIAAGTATGGLIFGDASPDAAGEIGYDGALKYYDAVGLKTVAVVDGALGTPSFTALNMPSSNADPGTTAGQIRHDSTDTGSNSGGTLKWYDGAQVRSVIDTGTNYSLITKYEYMPIRYAEDDDTVTAPAAAAEIGTTSLIARSFAADADNGVVFFWQIPGDYVSGIKYRVFYAIGTNASADETVTFGLSGCAFGSSGAIACTEGTAVNVSHELTTDEDTGELLVTGWSAAVTIDGTPATGKIAKLLLIRDVSEDDAAGAALVAGIEIKYVGKINPFSDY